MKYLVARLVKLRAFVRRNYTTLMLMTIFFCIFVLLGYAVAGEHNSRILLDRQNQQLEEIRKSQETIRKIAEDNIFLADRNMFYTKCVSDLIAKYTQTLAPITIDSLYDCQLTIDNGRSSHQPFMPTLNSTCNGSPCGVLPSAPNNSGQEPRPDNSQNPPEPDNEGIIVDLPLLPKIHIPSPL